jgi:hypothetical protein
MLMSASRQSFLRGMAFAAGMAGACQAFAAAVPGVAANPILQCRASLGATEIEWTVELDDAIPLATVDSLDAPADYSNGHARVRLSASGPNLVIGLMSGRLLVTAVDGQALGKGACKPLISVTTRKVVTIAALAGPQNSFRLTAALPARSTSTA